MNRIFQLIAQGAASMADSYISPRGYVRLSKNGFIEDQNNLRGDVANVGTSMRKAIAKYGQQSRKLASSK